MQSRPVPLDIPVSACTIPVARVSLGSAVAACNIRHAKDCSPHVPALVPHLGNYGIRCDHMLAKSPTLLMLQTLTCQPRRTKNHKIPPLQLTGTSPSTVLLLSAVFWQDSYPSKARCGSSRLPLPICFCTWIQYQLVMFEAVLPILYNYMIKE